jgi:glutaryl-CoA dehydrogenase
MAVVQKVAQQPKALPAPNGDFYELAETLSPDEQALVKQVRAFMESKVAPIINKYWADDAFPFEVLPALRELNIGGLGLKGYGCRGGSAKLFGFVAMELARIDASFGTFFGVHDGLAMGSIYLDGSEEQKQKWLPPMARFEKVGCFGLTEPLVGSGAGGGLTTTAKREGDTWVLNGQKKWSATRRGAMFRSSGRATSPTTRSRDSSSRTRRRLGSASRRSKTRSRSASSRMA